MDFWILQAFNGLTFAAVLFLLGGGLSLIFGVMRVINITQGAFFLVGGYIGYTVIAWTGNFYLGLVAACTVICLIGIAMESTLLRDMVNDNLRMMLITMGVALILQDLCLVIWGGDPLSIDVPKYLAGTIRIGGINFSTLRTFMLLAAAFLYLALWLFDKKTRVGAMVRAAVDNPEIADGLGINVTMVRMGVFGLGSLLAGFGGVFGCAFMAVYPGLDFELLPYAFVVVILGGLGSLPGALLGAIIVGLADNFSKALIPELSYFSVFAPMAIVLAWRPTGLMGKS